MHRQSDWPDFPETYGTADTYQKSDGASQQSIFLKLLVICAKYDEQLSIITIKESLPDLYD